MSFVEFQISLSTAEEEQNYFSEFSRAVPTVEKPSAVLLPGTYRVIDGSLYQVLPGIPPMVPLAPEK